VEVFGPGGSPLAREAPGRLAAESVRNRRALLTSGANQPAPAAEGDVRGVPLESGRGSGVGMGGGPREGGETLARRGPVRGFIEEGGGLVGVGTAAGRVAAPAAGWGELVGMRNRVGFWPGDAAVGGSPSAAVGVEPVGPARSYGTLANPTLPAVVGASAASAAAAFSAAEFPAAAPVADSSPAPADAAAVQVRKMFSR